MQVLSKGNHISSVIKSIATNELIASTTLLSPSDFNGTLHYHENAHFSFVLKGGCAERKKNNYERLPGSITFYEPGEIHQITSVTKPSFHVNFELPSSFYKIYGINPETIAKAIDKHPDARTMMLKVYKELGTPDANTICSLELILLNLIHETAKRETNGIPKWVGIAAELINDRWQEKITLNELSIACGIHPVTISKYFPYYFSCTLGEYLRKQKIHRAIAMIKQSSNELSNIAFTCGFADQSHFIRTFKAITGFLPEAYRKL